MDGLEKLKREEREARRSLDHNIAAHVRELKGQGRCVSENNMEVLNSVFNWSIFLHTHTYTHI